MVDGKVGGVHRKMYAGINSKFFCEVSDVLVRGFAANLPLGDFFLVEGVAAVNRLNKLPC
jgi:hypothetical protein